MQFDDKFLKNYKEVILGLIVIFLAVFMGFKQVTDSIVKVHRTTQEHKKQNQKLQEVKKQLAEYEKTKENLLAKQNKMKPIFDPKSAPQDSIASFGGIFEDIIDYVKMNGLRLRSVEYKINPADDPIYSKFPNLYNVCSVNLFVVGTYDKLEGFIRDLNVYPYFVNIAEIKIAPYEKDNNYLLINISITLYSKKQSGGGDMPASAEPVPGEAAPNPADNAAAQ